MTVAALGTVTSSGLTGVTHTGGGVFTVAGMTADTGYVEIEFSFGGASTALRVPYTKSKDGAPFVTGSASVSGPGTTTYAQVAVVSLLMGPSGNLSVDANGSFNKSGAGGSLSVDGYYEASLDGGSSWASLAGSFVANPAVGTDDGEFTATSAVSGASIGLATSQTVMVRLMMRKTNTSLFGAFSGTMALSWAGS